VESGAFLKHINTNT